MTITPGRRAVALSGGLLVMTLVGSTAAAAAAKPVTAAPRTALGQPVTFGIQPSGPRKPDLRPDFSYSATKGAVARDYVAVSNYTGAPLTLRVYASDAFNNSDGGFDLLAASKAPTDVGSWVRLGKTVLTLPGQSRTILPFTLAIPANAEPGDHAGGIVASLSTVRTDAKGNRIRVDLRVGARIYLRVAGPLHPKIIVSRMTSAYHGTLNPFGAGSVTLTYTLRNVGNIRLGLRQAAQVYNFLGSAHAQGLRNLRELLPGNAWTVTTVLPGVAPGFLSSANVTADLVSLPGNVDPALPSVAHTGSLWTVPWTLLAIVLVLIAGGVAVILLRRRRKRSRGDTTPPPTVKKAATRTALP